MISCHKAATSTILTMEELFPSFTLTFLINLPVLHYPFYFTSPTARHVRGKGWSLGGSKVSCSALEFPAKLLF